MRQSNAHTFKKRTLPLRDKRSKLDLELFVLALVGREVNTPYLLRKTVGLSPGATLPVLKRLQEAGYVQRGNPGARGRTEFKVTRSGKQHLASNWKPLLEAGSPADLEVVLRIVSLAILSGANWKTVASTLKRFAAMKLAESKLTKREAETMETSLLLAQDIGLYGWMQTSHKTARLASEAKLLRRIATAILRRT